MKEKSINVLLIEDDEEDYMITQDVIDEIKDTPYQLSWISNFEDGLEAIKNQHYDIYLVDYRLGKENGLMLINEARGLEQSSPMILLTGNDDIELDLEAMKSGAADFLVKGQITPVVLDRSLRYSLQLNETIKKLRRSQDQLNEAQAIAKLGHFDIDMLNSKIDWSDEHYRIFGLEPLSENFTHEKYLDFVVPEDVIRIRALMKSFQPDDREKEIELYINAADGKRKCLIQKLHAHFNEEGLLVRVYGVTQDITEQRERENRLNVLRSAIENAAIPISWADMEGKIVFVNQAFLDLWGYQNAEEVLRRNIGEFSSNPEVEKVVKESMMKHGNWQAEDIAKKKDGSTFNVFISCDLIRDENGQPVNILASFLNITQLKQQEIQIAKEKETAQTYLEMAGSLIVVIEKDETVKLINREGCKLLGCKEEEIIGKNWFDHFIPEHERAEVRKVFHQVLNGELDNIEFFENHILNKTKGERLIRWYNRVLREVDGSIIAAISSGVDITEQKKAGELLKSYANDLEKEVKAQTEQLALSQAKLEEASKLARIGYWEIDLRGESPVVNFSKEYCQLYEVEGDAFKEDSRYFLQFISDQDRERVVKLTRRALSTGEDQLFDYQLKTAKGKQRYFRAEFKCLKNEKGEVERTFSVVQDITEQKKAALQLEKSLKKERELGQLKSRFVSMASHEFRTPLSSIMSSISLIEMYNEKGNYDKQIKHVRRIQSSVNNLTTILNDFLSLEKLESGKVQVNPEPINFVDFVGELKEDVKAMIKENQQIVHQHDGELVAMIDPHLLKNIMLNLTSNAVKYSDKGTTVTIRSFRMDQQLIVEVIDQGIGIPEEDQKHMFTRFFRATNVATIKGTGLGLTIVKRYLDLMGGTIGFTSKHGEGTTFKVTIPLEQLS